MSCPDNRQAHPRFEQVLVEYLRRIDAGEAVDCDQFVAEHPDFAEELRDHFETAERIEQVAAASDQTQDSGNPPLVPPPQAVIRNCGDYELLEEIARGGMGVVYRARQVSLNRIVALKMILAGEFASENDVKRFHAEAEAAAHLDHPNIVPIFEIREHDRQHYFAMGFVEGESLAKKVARGPLPPQEAARILEQLARAVAYAHEQGVIHRDLKPGNILIDGDGQPHIADFGLAKQVASDSHLTRSGQIVGTPSYMSPEQAAGTPGEIGPAADIYSLGAVLYAVLTGRPPFSASRTCETLNQVRTQDPVAPRKLNPAVPRDLEIICLKCLEKRPHKRYAAAGGLAEDLERFLQGVPIRAKPQHIVQRIGHWIGGIPLVAVLTGRSVRRPTIGQRRAQRLILLVPVLALIGLGAWAVWPQTLPRTIRIAAGQSGGMYHPLSSDLCPALEKTLDRAMEVVETSGSLENVQLLESETVQMALLQSSTFSSADLSIVAPLYYETVYLVVRADEPITSVEQLRGKAVALGDELSGMRFSALKLLDCYGLSEQDLRDTDRRFTELLDDASLQAAIITAGSNNATDVKRVLSDPRFVLLPLTDAERVSRRKECFRATHIARRPFLNQAADPTDVIPTVMTPAFLVVRADASEHLVTSTLEALYQETSLLETYGLISLQEAAEWKSWGLHPAARRFFESASGDQ